VDPGDAICRRRAGAILHDGPGVSRYQARIFFGHALHGAAVQNCNGQRNDRDEHRRHRDGHVDPMVAGFVRVRSVYLDVQVRPFRFDMRLSHLLIRRSRNWR